MNIAICDDNMEITQDLKKRVLNYISNPQNICIYNSAEKLLDSEVIPDIVFLDIELGTKNGLECAEELRKRYPDIIIIFVSSHKEYVFDAFRSEAFHFMVKPIKDSEFSDVFGRALIKYNLMFQFYDVSWHGERAALCVSDITYIEGYHRRLKFHTKTGEYLHTGKMSEVMDKLVPHGFLLVHQGYLVNMQYIEHFGKTEVTLQGGVKIPISGRKRHEALLKFDKFVMKRMW